MPHIVLVFFDAGSGHRSAADALKTAIRDQFPQWTIELLNLDEVLLPVDPAYRLTGRCGSDWYNWWLRTGWTYGSRFFLPIVHRAIRRMLKRPHERILRARWRRMRPDLVVSTIPHYNGALYRKFARRTERHPIRHSNNRFRRLPPTLLDRGSSAALHCRNSESRCSGSGHQPAVPSLDSFWNDPASHVLPPAAAKQSGRTTMPRAGSGTLNSDCNVRRRRITTVGESCALPGRLPRPGDFSGWSRSAIRGTFARSIKLPYPARVENLTKNVAELMQLADFFIGKPGPGSLAEALHLGLPVIVESSRRTPVHEQFNIEWIGERGLGLALHDFRQLPQAIAKLTGEGVLEAMQQRIAKLDNRAVFEVVEILAATLTPAPSLRCDSLTDC